MNPVRSEKGVALIIVLMLLAVMAGLTAGLSLNSQTEIAMAHNETYYAGARAAAEAGMNRAVEQIIGNTTDDLLATTTIPNINNGPFDLTSEYSYRFEILDDDDPSLYPTPLTAAQLAKMGENGDGAVNANTRMLLRCIGTGPRNTTVTVTRVLSSIEIPDLPETETVISNPAILVNGDLDIAGNAHILGLKGNVHANGDITGGGSLEITGDVTATGTVDDDIDAAGLVAGGMPPITVPAIKAEDFFNLADYILTSAGTIQVKDPAGAWVVCSKPPTACPAGWTPPAVAGGPWTASGGMPDTGTYYVQGPVEVSGVGGGKVFTQLSLIAEGSIHIQGNGKFKPENDQKIQFVTNGDFELEGGADADDPIDMDGQIMVREQIKLTGTTEFQGRVMVEDRDSDLNSCAVAAVAGCRKGTSTLMNNSLDGNMTVTYNGGLGDIVTTFTTPPGPSSYTNNVSGWIEQ
jgi:cytoskeletal protein CcmA (bactofilin family)